MRQIIRSEGYNLPIRDWEFDSVKKPAHRTFNFWEAYLLGEESFSEYTDKQIQISFLDRANLLLWSRQLSCSTVPIRSLHFPLSIEKTQAPKN